MAEPDARMKCKPDGNPRLISNRHWGKVTAERNFKTDAAGPIVIHKNDVLDGSQVIGEQSIRPALGSREFTRSFSEFAARAGCADRRD